MTKPDGFSSHPGAVATSVGSRLGKGRSPRTARLIARGLNFVHSGARQQIEKLLTDFTVVKTRPAPRMPIYRSDTEGAHPFL